MSSASLEDGVMNRDPTRPRAQAFCFFFAKRKGVISSDTLSAAKLPVAGLRRRQVGYDS